jgi:cytochrome c oxidase accessory protein FixG
LLDARPVEGTFRRLRWVANALLVAVLFAIPWIRIAGEPLVLLDVPGRKFHVFGLVIFPQELFFLWLIIAGLALSLFFFTALLGRLWCGWACPQTVFTDVFAAIGRRIEGWKGSRRPARVALWRRVATHLAWLACSVVIGFHLVGYFRSPYQMLSGSFGAASAGFLVAASMLSYLDFVWVRQTFCKWLCPYARFQGVLFDRDTLVIGYDTRRGEPRGKRGRAAGDCVDCGLCVAVCPTGIDIRNGLQLECIACTQCIDACNGVMDRVGRARNLIGYRSLVAVEGLRPARLLRPRVVAYGALLAGFGVAFALLLAGRLPMELTVAHNRDALFTKTADGRLGNAFTLHVENRDRAERVFRLRIEESEHFDLVAGVNPLRIGPTSAIEARVFVVARSGEPEESREIRFVLEDTEDLSRRVVRKTSFFVPGGGRAG